MSKKTLINKNFKLSTKLAEYIANNPEKTKNFPSGSTYVAISARDSELNNWNMRLIEKLVNQGKKVIKAVEKKKNKNNWEFNSISP